MIKLRDFVDQGDCTQVGGEMFFTDQAGDTTSRAVKKVCLGCPVIEPCFNWAMAQGYELSGTWAGTTQKERISAHRRRNGGLK